MAKKKLKGKKGKTTISFYPKGPKAKTYSAMPKN